MSIGATLSKVKRRSLSAVRSSLINDVAPASHYQSTNDIPTQRHFQALSERLSLPSILPYESFDDESGLYYNRDTVGFLLYASPAVGLSDTNLDILNGIFNQSHSPDTLIQVTLVADPNVEPILQRWADQKGKAVNQSLDSIFSLMTQERLRYMAQGKWDSLLDDQAYLPRNFHLLFSFVIPIPLGEMDISVDQMESLKRSRETIISALSSASIPSQIMPPELFINIISGLLNPSRQAQPKLEYDCDHLIGDQMIDGDTAAVFDSGVSNLIHQGEAFSIIPYHVRQFPKQWQGWRNSELIGSFSNNIMRMPCPFVATLTVTVPDQVAVKSKVARKTARSTQMAESPIAKYAPQWRERKRDWDDTSRQVEAGNKLLSAFYQIILITPVGTESHCESSLKAVYDSIGWTLTKSRFIPVHSLLGALPMGLCQETQRALKLFGHFRTRGSSTCTNIAPWVGEWKGTQTPAMLFTGRRGQLVYFNAFDNTKGNYNLSCCATSGSGKSFFTQEWIFSTLAAGGLGFVIDAGHSYRNLCSLINGVYLDFGSRDGDIRLNPFSSIDTSKSYHWNEQFPLIKMLIAQMASPDTPLTNRQLAVLEKAISSTWDEYKNKTSIRRVAERLKSDISDDSPLEHTGKDLALALHPYSHGMYSAYFEGDSNIDFNNPFVVLELDALNKTPDLQSVVLLILMLKITQIMYLSGNRSQRKVCIIDEAWRLLGRGRSGDFIAEGYRVARKHGGSFMTITQKVSDYFTSETAKAAYMNSDYAIYLRQKPEELKAAETAGHIDNSDGKLDLLRSLETIQGKYSELAISSPDGIAIARFSVDRIAGKLYSTQAADVDFIQQKRREGLSVYEAIHLLLQHEEGRGT